MSQVELNAEGTNSISLKSPLPPSLSALAAGKRGGGGQKGGAAPRVPPSTPEEIVQARAGEWDYETGQAKE